MNDFSLGFCTATVVLGIVANLPFSSVTKYDKAIKECEKTLPRDQHCKVIGVVDKDLENK
jgi:hypothetical protein